MGLSMIFLKSCSIEDPHSFDVGFEIMSKHSLEVFDFASVNCFNELVLSVLSDIFFSISYSKFSHLLTAKLGCNRDVKIRLL